MGMLRRGLGFWKEFLGGRYLNCFGLVCLWKINFILELLFL